jgi:hypothetical protein
MVYENVPNRPYDPVDDAKDTIDSAKMLVINNGLIQMLKGQPPDFEAARKDAIRILTKQSLIDEYAEAKGLNAAQIQWCMEKRAAGVRWIQTHDKLEDYK